MKKWTREGVGGEYLNGIRTTGISETGFDVKNIQTAIFKDGSGRSEGQT